MNRLCCASLILCASFLGACGRSGTEEREERRPPRYQVETYRVTTEPFAHRLNATGTLLASEFVEIQSERSGLVTEIAFEEGVPVRAGEVLVRIDDSELRAELARAQARLALETAQEERQRTLLQQRNIAAAVYDESLANLNIARAEVGLINAQLARTLIRAPFDGVPGLREISLGSFLTPGTPITSFQDISSLRIDLAVPERYIPFLRVGQHLEIRVAGRNERFLGEIFAIEPGVDVSTRSVLLRGRVPNEGGALKPGQFAEIAIELEENPEAILIPSLALIPGLRENRVLVYEDGVVAEREVSVGIRTSTAIQILEGLAPGDRVITTGILQLRPGMEVDVRQESTKIPEAETPLL